jgi:hypothetical protein
MMVLGQTSECLEAEHKCGTFKRTLIVMYYIHSERKGKNKKMKFSSILLFRDTL